MSTISAGEGLTYQDLIENSVTGTATIATTASSRLGNRVELVKEHDTRSSSSSLVKDVSDVGFRFTEPHREELGTLDGDEVGLALVCDAAWSAR
jgi:hypothetical protein